MNTIKKQLAELSKLKADTYGKDFLLIKGTRTSVVIDLQDSEFSRIIVTTRHSLSLLKALRLPPLEASDAQEIAAD